MSANDIKPGRYLTEVVVKSSVPDRGGRAVGYATRRGVPISLDPASLIPAPEEGWQAASQPVDERSVSVVLPWSVVEVIAKSERSKAHRGSYETNFVLDRCRDAVLQRDRNKMLDALAAAFEAVEADILSTDFLKALAEHGYYVKSVS